MGSEKVKSPLYGVIEQLSHKHSVSLLLRITGLSSSGFYKWKKTDFHSQQDKIKELKEHIQAIHAVRPEYGYRRMTWALRREGFLVNHKKVYSLMKKMGIKSIIRKKRNYGGKKGSNTFPNLLNRQFKSSQRYEKLVTDITYIPTHEGMMYLSVVQDLYNNEIVSYQISDKNDLLLVLDTIKKLPSEVNNISILHSDQGMQYVNLEYKNVLSRRGIRGSHSRRGNCYDNACIESFFSHLKSETGLVRKVADKSTLSNMIHEYISFYNQSRFQKRLGQLSPIEYREKLAA